jgi:hypothetical protein
MLRRNIRLLAVVALTGAVTACGENYFSGPGINTNPNVPSVAQANQLLVGFTGYNQYNLLGDNNRIISIFAQQIAGTGRQWAQYDNGYSFDENTFPWDGFYTGGGLIDIRKVEAAVDADKVYLGVAQVWEALTVATIADLWGDMPYSQALGASQTPTLDKQLDVYAAVQTLLDKAIANLGGAGTGPGSSDLIYGGDKNKWLKAAYTLKARYYMHTAEVDASSYAKALTAAQAGIASPSGDFTSYQSGSIGEQGHWYQFRIGRGTDIGIGKVLVDMMKARNDPRLTAYFSAGPAANGVINGAAPGQEDDGTIAWLSATRGDPAYRQPMVTYAENQMILAEAQFKTGATAPALATLNSFRATVPLPALTVAGTDLYTAIMQEKYIALFQNIEVWNDYKRTCYPNLTPTDGSNTIPARLLYSGAERSSNPNIPSPSQAPKRNANDPKTPTSTDGSVCKGQG